MFDNVLHKKLKSPYLLNVEVLHAPKRPSRTLILLHGIGSSTVMWRNVADDLPREYRVVAIDLLGFGKSPRPEWATYDAKTQARSIIFTLLVRRVPLKSWFVGHSLGSIVAVEVARSAPLHVKELLLISPPIYKPSKGKVVATQKEDILRGVYKILNKYPKNTTRALMLAKKYYVKRTKAQVTPELHVTTFLASLEAAVINQNTIDHIGDIAAPITILSGTRDPLIVSRNLSSIARQRETIHHVRVKKAGHNIVGVMKTAVINQLRDQ